MVIGAGKAAASIALALDLSTDGLVMHLMPGHKREESLVDGEAFLEMLQIQELIAQ